MPWIAAAILLALASWRALPVWSAQLAHPADLVYETPSLRTIELVAAGRNPYDEAVYARGPLWLSMYTPLHAYVVAPFQGLSSNPFLAGRVVALISLAGAFAALLLVRGRAVAVALAAVGALLLVRPLLSNSALVKSDLLGLLLSVLAVVCAQRAREKRSWLFACALLCVAAFATKQSFVAAAVASCGWLLLSARRRGLELVALLGAGYAIFLALAFALFGRGFVFCAFEAPQNPMQWDQFRSLWSKFAREPVAMTLLGLGAAVLVIELARKRSGALRESPFALYVLASAAVATATLPKAGADTNYFFEWLFASCLLLVHASGELARASRAVAACAALLCAAAVAETVLGKPHEYSFANREISPQIAASLRQTADEIRRISGERPRMLNLHYAGLSHPLPGELCINDPYLYSLLWASGKIDPAPMIAAVRAREYDGVLVPPNVLNHPQFKLAPDLRRALLDNYRGERHFPGFDYLVPKE